MANTSETLADRLVEFSRQATSLIHELVDAGQRGPLYDALATMHAELTKYEWWAANDAGAKRHAVESLMEAGVDVNDITSMRVVKFDSRTYNVLSRVGFDEEYQTSVIYPDEALVAGYCLHGEAYVDTVNLSASTK